MILDTPNVRAVFYNGPHKVAITRRVEVDNDLWISVTADEVIVATSVEFWDGWRLLFWFDPRLTLTLFPGDTWRSQIVVD